MANSIQAHQSITLLTQGQSNPFVAKTAISLLRYRAADVVAVLDSEVDSRTADELFGTGGDIPVVSRVGEVESDALYIGIAPPGGKMPVEWRPVILEAIKRKMDIVSGLHDFLNRDSEYVEAARQSGVQLIDVRENSVSDIASGQPFRRGCKRILSVGQDCSVGKMVATLEVDRGLKNAGIDSQFLATGQTGIMITGAGVPIDCVIADFVNGAVERLVAEHQDHEFLLVEGQGSITHPAYSAVTLGLLHGCQPDGLIFCYEAGRSQVKGLKEIDLPAMRTQMDCYLALANSRHPCSWIGIAVNTRTLDPESARVEVERVESEFGLPACDVYRDGSEKLVDACRNMNVLENAV